LLVVAVVVCILEAQVVLVLVDFAQLSPQLVVAVYLNPHFLLLLRLIP
jgi:hypothetical protein